MRWIEVMPLSVLSAATGAGTAIWLMPESILATKQPLLALHRDTTGLAPSKRTTWVLALRQRLACYEILFHPVAAVAAIRAPATCTSCAEMSLGLRSLHQAMN